MFAERLGLTSQRVPDGFVTMFSRAYPDKIKSFNAAAEKLAAEITNRYPLLFSESRDAITKYIEMIDTEETD